MPRSSSARRLIRVNLWWGGPNGVARRKPGEPGESRRSGVRLGDLRPHRALRATRTRSRRSSRSSARPSWANASARLERRADERGRPEGVRDRGRAALLGHVQAAGRHDAGRVANWIAWNEPNNPVFLKPQFVRSGSKWVIQSAKDYAKICNAVVDGGEVGQRRRTRSPAASRRRAATTSRARSARPSRRSRSCGR